MMEFLQRTLGPLARRRTDRLPRNVRLPCIYRLGAERESERVSNDPLGRDSSLAAVEALLLAADEPLPARKLAQAAGLSDAAAARRLVKKLQTLYERDDTAFQVEELAGGYQLL